MKKTTLLHQLFASVLACAAHAGSLESDFAQPPDTTKPRCYWYWMDGQITKDGITRDLEAMKRVGIGEGYIGVITGQSGTPGNSTTKALTDEWWSYIEHAIREGTRLGVDVGFFNSPGWSQSGGPWVKPSQAMRYVALPELRLKGPQHFAGKLPVPPGEFQDLAVLAFPAPAGEDEIATISARTPTAVTFEMPAAFTARSLTVQPLNKQVSVTAELQSSADGQNYQTVKKFSRNNLGVGMGPLPLAPIIETFPATTARFFRLTFSAACEVGEIRLSPAARVEYFADKALQKVCPVPHALYDYYTWPVGAEPESAGLIVKPDAVLDISKSMAADGTLTWDVPAGDWIVMRTAMTPTGARNAPAPPEATGYEVDKMNRVPLRAHFEAYVGNLLKRMPAAERKSWKHVVADSYEVGSQNWTDGLAADFQKRYGYDPMPFLPVMTGRVVGSVDQSDRFLWDLRRMVADRMGLDYVGGLSDLCREHGLKMWLENYGHWGFPAEFLQYGSLCDEIAGEFWVGTGDFLNPKDTYYLGRYELRDAASAANIYGKPITWAESFTGGPAFINSPRSLKALGDWAFCQGINQFVLHVNIHQPTDKKPPGVNSVFGTEFNRNNTWFEQSKAWIDYQRRSTVLLQSGKHVADVAYFISEDSPKFAGPQQPPLPPGFDYDFINADVIEHRLAVKDGRLVLPDGMNFRLLALPESATMRPELLKKIGELVKAGATVVGTPPKRSPSLENFPKCDAEVQNLARAIWGETDLKQPGEHPFGKGRVFWGKSLTEILATLGSKPDFESSQHLGFIHRHSDSEDIYFVANQKEEAMATTAAFRVGDKAPELWWPDSGRIEHPAVYDTVDGVVRLPLSFGPAGSVFVVFRDKAASKAERIVSVTRNGKEVLGTTVKPQVTEVVGDNPGNFSYAVWVKPGDDTTLIGEANSGIVGFSEKRNEVFFPTHGGSFGTDPANAGCGLAVGRNGVSVFEHGGDYFAPTLVHAAALTDWTHVAVVYRDGQPSLYLNGVLARIGLKSTHKVHFGAGSAGDAKYRGELSAIKAFARPLGEAEIVGLMTAMGKPEKGSGAVPIQLTRNKAGRIVAQGGEQGDYEVKFADDRVRTLKVASVAVQQEITGPWEVIFAPGWGAPEKIAFDTLTDWTKRPEDGIKFFSGKATYRRTFEVPARRQPGSVMILDLGQVNDIAVVRVNGRELATLWVPPYRLDITATVNPGTNTLEVDVVNTWNNRLVGDATLPVEQRLTSITAATVTKDTPLTPAGLVGPVSLRYANTTELNQTHPAN